MLWFLLSASMGISCGNGTWTSHLGICHFCHSITLDICRHSIIFGQICHHLFTWKQMPPPFGICQHQGTLYSRHSLFFSKSLRFWRYLELECLWWFFLWKLVFLSCFGSEGPRVLFGICPRRYWLDHWNLKESESEFIEYHVINQIACYLQHGDVNDRKRMNTKNNVTLNSHPIHPTFWSAALRLIIIIVQWWWHASVGTESNANYHGYSTPLGQRGGLRAYTGCSECIISEW